MSDGDGRAGAARPVPVGHIVWQNRTPGAIGGWRRIAAAYLRFQRPDHTLPPTALLNEAYINRPHFFATAGAIMRNILVDHAVAAGGETGRGLTPVPLELAMDQAAGKPADLVALDDTLQALATRDERKARVLELRYSG